MTVRFIDDVFAFICASTDTKPADLSADQAGWTLFESDTGGVYKWTGAAWVDGESAALQALRGAIDALAGAMVVEQGQFDYETVAASQSDQALGTGAAGDFLHKLILVVATAATAATSIKDGSGSAISVLPNSPGGGIGVYEVEFNIRSTSGAWKVTTGAGVSVIAIGRFTP